MENLDWIYFYLVEEKKKKKKSAGGDGDKERSGFLILITSFILIRMLPLVT